VKEEKLNWKTTRKSLPHGIIRLKIEGAA